MTDAMREAVRNGLEAAGFENVNRIITDAECDALVEDVIRAAVDGIPDSPIAAGYVEIGGVLMRRDTLVSALAGGGET